MRSNTASSLADALLATERIQEAMRDVSLERYLDDWLPQAGVERFLMNIGAALTVVRREEPPVFLRIPAGRDIIDFRHLLAHGYNKINPVEVCQTVARSLPPLVKILEELIAQAEREGH